MQAGEALVEITGVDLPEPEGSVIAGRSLGRPVAGAPDPRYAGTFTFDLRGWVVGARLPATRISVAHDGTALWEVPVGDARPEVTAMFPGVPGAESPGFYACVSALPLPHDFELSVTAVLSDGRESTYAPLGRVIG